MFKHKNFKRFSTSISKCNVHIKGIAFHKCLFAHFRIYDSFFVLRLRFRIGIKTQKDIKFIKVIIIVVDNSENSNFKMFVLVCQNVTPLQFGKTIITQPSIFLD